MRPIELSRSGLLGSLAVLLVVVMCLRLGFWQLDRRDQRMTQNAAIAERMDAAPVRLDGLPSDTAGLTYRRATVRGRLDSPRAVVLGGRSLAGSPGVHILVPLRLGVGALLVNRGWMPSPDAATVDVEPVALEGEVRVEGVLLPFPRVTTDPATHDRTAGFQKTWYRLSGDAIRAQYPYPVAPLYLLATGRPQGPAADETVRTLPVILEPPSLEPGPHLSYAVQWFSFATIFLFGWLALLVRRVGRDRGVRGAGGAGVDGGRPGPPIAGA